MEKINNKFFDKERSLYMIQNTELNNVHFEGPNDGESVLKETKNIVCNKCVFGLRYPLWHSKDINIKDSIFQKTARAALWYDNNIKISNSKLYGIKAFRESKNILIDKCDVISPEFMWKCNDVVINEANIESEYAMFETNNIYAKKSCFAGKYTFQYNINDYFEGCIFDTKDAFWHSKNVTVVDSLIKGEYLGWYSESLHLIRCKIISHQPLCYCKNLVLEDCILEDCDLCFEYSSVTANVLSSIGSIKNPLSGKIVCESCRDVILDHSKYKSRCKIITKK